MGRWPGAAGCLAKVLAPRSQAAVLVLVELDLTALAARTGA